MWNNVTIAFACLWMSVSAHAAAGPSEGHSPRLDPKRPYSLPPGCKTALDFEDEARAGGAYTVLIDRKSKLPVAFEIEDKFAGAPQRVGSEFVNPVRKWSFDFYARNQYSGVAIRETLPDGTTVSRSFEIFPKTQLPTIRFDSEKPGLTVTLSNGETMSFDASSKKVIGGVFSESSSSSGLKNISYNGSGFLLEYGETLVARKGKLTCSLLKGDIYMLTDKKECVHQVQKYRFKSDAELSAFFAKKCGFTFAVN